MTAAAPVFIFAAPYSGVSRLAAMLGRHPGICAVPELNLFMGDDIGELFEISDIAQGLVIDGLLRAIAQLGCGGQSDDEIQQAHDWLEQNRHRSTRAVLQQLQAWASPKILLIPDAQTPLRPMDLKRCSHAVPDARYLHLTRHPYTQGTQFAPELEQRLFVPADYKDHCHTPAQIDPQIPWLRANRNILSFIMEVGARKFSTVADESLTIDPDATLTGICSEWGLDVGSNELALMRDYRAWSFWPPGPYAAPRGLEAEAYQLTDAKYQRRAAAPAALDVAMPWKPDHSGFAPEVRELAIHFGYR